MAIAPGAYRLGPDTGTLSVRTGRAGAIAKVGHDLRLEVGAWEASAEIGTEPDACALALTADSRSLTVREGTGGMKALDDEDRANIAQTIDDEVLRGTPISFRSRSVSASETGRLRAEGELELWGSARPVSFELSLTDDGALSGEALITQSDWGVKPYTALFGTLKVADEVKILIDARLAPVAATDQSR